MLNILNFFKIKRQQNIANGRVKVGKKTYIDQKSDFEGKNSVALGSSVIDSYMGYGTYCASNCFIRNTKIGRYCCIGKNVRIIDVTHPSKKFVSVHPAFFSKQNVVDLSYVSSNKFQENLRLDDSSKYAVEIGNDVWICDGVQIIGGHSIGDGAIVAAGAVVTSDVPPYAIVAGVPAKMIRSRFSPEEIAFLMQLRWWDKEEIWIQKYAEFFEDIQKLQEIIQRDQQG